MVKPADRLWLLLLLLFSDDIKIILGESLTVVVLLIMDKPSVGLPVFDIVMTSLVSGLGPGLLLRGMS